MNKLIGKIIISGTIKTVTGLHIGGSKSSLDIGGVDLNVVKTPNGVPFIPGSSLKGKMRSLLARLEGSVAISKKELDDKNTEKADEDFPYLIELFGFPGDEKGKGTITRLLVRDAGLNTAQFKNIFPEEEAVLEMEYTDVKWENRIDRKRGTAKDPRQLERVPAGALFAFEMIYDWYSDSNIDYGTEGVTRLQKHLAAIETAMNLLQDDYLGGQGSRGYGKVIFEQVQVLQKDITAKTYKTATTMDNVVKTFADNLKQLSHAGSHFEV